MLVACGSDHSHELPRPDLHFAQMFIPFGSNTRPLSYKLARAAKWVVKYIKIVPSENDYFSEASGAAFGGGRGARAAAGGRH